MRGWMDGRTEGGLDSAHLKKLHVLFDLHS